MKESRSPEDPNSLDVVEMDIETVKTALASGDMTAEQLARRHVERIETYNAFYNAVIFQNPAVLEDAKEIDRRRKAGQDLGPLAGVPVVVKDTMDTIGFPTTGGWRYLSRAAGGASLYPQRDAVVVSRLRAAGALILGKTNVPILSHSGSHANDSWAGPTINAASPAHVPGGSSAGTATAVAASFAVVGLGEETGGSIQNPAAAQALVGIKPSFGLVPTTGVMPLSGRRDVVGPLARCVRDAALTLDVIAGPSLDDTNTVPSAGRKPSGGYSEGLRVSSLSGCRIGTYGPGWREQPLSSETHALYQAAIHEVAACGATLIDDPFEESGFAELRQPTPPLPDYDARGLESFPYDLNTYLRGTKAPAGFRDFAELMATTASDDFFGPDGPLGFLANLPGFDICRRNPAVAPDHGPFDAVRQSYVDLFDRVFARHALDAVVLPHAWEELPLLHERKPIGALTVCEINIAGLPAVTVPAGRYESGAPFSLVLVGRSWSEPSLLGYAFAYEQHTRHRQPPILRSI